MTDAEFRRYVASDIAKDIELARVKAQWDEWYDRKTLALLKQYLDDCKAEYEERS